MTCSEVQFLALLQNSWVPIRKWR